MAEKCEAQSKVEVVLKKGTAAKLNHTWTLERNADSSQLIEKNGGDDETRTRDLCRDRAAF